MTGGGGEVGVKPEALQHHAAVVQRLADVVGQAAAAADQVVLGAEAYGRLWPAIPGLLNPLQAAAAAVLRDAGADLAGTGRDLRVAAGGYEAVDDRTSTRFGGSDAVRPAGRGPLPELPL
jgi:hypothetical protein